MYRPVRYAYQSQRCGLPNNIYQTYILLTGCIGIYLAAVYAVGSYALSSPPVTLFAMVGSIALLFFTMVSRLPICLFAFSFTLGIIHNPLFNLLNLMDPGIIEQALGATFMVFVGLSYLAFNTCDYPTFLLYGLLYSSLSTLVWVGLLNIFFQNSLLDLLLTYFSIMVFSIFVIYDTHELVKNNYKTPVEHALQLFLDFVNMFINLIKLIRHLKKRNN